MNALFSLVLTLALTNTTYKSYKTYSVADPVVTEAVISAPVAEVWRAFTTKEGIESWMVAKTQFELKVGAVWKTSYKKDSTLDDDSSIRHEILAYDPEKMFSFHTVKPPKGFPFPNEIVKTWCVVYFTPEGNDKTRVMLKMLGFDDTADSKTMRGHFEAGNKYTMDQLVKKFSKGSRS